MRHEVLDRVQAALPYLRDQAEEAEQLGRLPDETAKRLRETGVVRLLQPARYGGYEADPRIFFEAVTQIAQCCGASGWLAGIIGVHPWELGVCDDRAQQEVWGTDPDTWMCSTYMPTGRAYPVDGGYRFEGRWQFSSGCDVSEWIFLGGVVIDDGPEMDTADLSKGFDPTKYLHFLLPRSDFTIVDGTWDVVGLCGTGSKDVVVTDAFVPDYRTIGALAINDGSAPGRHLWDAPLTRVPWAAIFPNAITAAVIGMCEGGLAAGLDYQRSRVSMAAGPIVHTPFTMSALGEAAGEIGASRAQMMQNLGLMYELAVANEPIPTEVRVRGRRDQVQGSWRAVRALDDIFDLAGGGSLRRGTPLQRLWRDAHAGLHHIINVQEKALHSYTSVAMGFDPLEPMF